jgi:hypothetical protein
MAVEYRMKGKKKYRVEGTRDQGYERMYSPPGRPTYRDRRTT